VLPTDLELTNYPNPFNPITTISFSLSEAVEVTLTVYDIQGSAVKTLVNGFREAGNYDVTFDGSGLPSGVYFARLSANGQNSIHQLTLMK
jgi:flagellar hook assembly protein FlgD